MSVDILWLAAINDRLKSIEDGLLRFDTAAQINCLRSLHETIEQIGDKIKEESH